MPHINTWKNNGLHREFSGEVTGEEILESNFELHANPKYHEISYLIDDFRLATNYVIDCNHIEIILKTNEIISMSKGKLKIALLVIDDEAIELAKQYIELSQRSRFQTKMFHHIDDVQKWVNS